MLDVCLCCASDRPDHRQDCVLEQGTDGGPRPPVLPDLAQGPAPCSGESPPGAGGNKVVVVVLVLVVRHF